MTSPNGRTDSALWISRMVVYFVSIAGLRDAETVRQPRLKALSWKLLRNAGNINSVPEIQIFKQGNIR